MIILNIIIFLLLNIVILHIINLIFRNIILLHLIFRTLLLGSFGPIHIVFRHLLFLLWRGDTWGGFWLGWQNVIPVPRPVSRPVPRPKTFPESWCWYYIHIPYVSDSVTTGQGVISMINFKLCFLKVIHSPASVPLGFWLYWEWKPFILFLLGIPEGKPVMLFQCLAKLLTWNCFWRCALEIWLQVDRSLAPSHILILGIAKCKLGTWFKVCNGFVKVFHSPASVPLGFYFFLRMDTVYFVSFGNARTQAGDAVSMLG